MSNPASLAPTELRDYLSAQGWSQRPEGVADRLYVLEHPHHPRRQLVFPMDDAAPDYDEAVARVIEKLAAMVGSSPEVALSQARAMRDDVLRLRVFSTTNVSSLPLSLATSMLQAMQQLLKAAACTAVTPRLYHPRLATTEAVQLVEQTRFEQTEQGSFVFKLSCPLDAMHERPGRVGVASDEAPFMRQVTAGLHGALHTLIDAIETDTLAALMTRLQHDPAPLLSVNLCDALVALHDEGVDNALDVEFHWSSRLPPSPALLQSPRLRFHRDYFARVEEVARALRPPAPHREDTFVGTVERLDGVMGEDGQRAGEVILALMAPDGEGVIKARARLSAPDYASANQAHMTDGVFVQVRGRLHPGRQPRSLDQITQFRMIARDEPAHV